MISLREVDPSRTELHEIIDRMWEEQSGALVCLGEENVRTLDELVDLLELPYEDSTQATNHCTTFDEQHRWPL